MANPRRSLLYISTFDPTVASTGTTTRGKLFLQWLAARYDVHAVYISDPNRGRPDAKLLSKLASSTCIPYSSLGYFGFSLGLYRAANKAIADHGIDVIFADFEKAGMYARLLSRKHSIPYIYNSHNVEYQRYLSLAAGDARRYPMVPYLYAIERFACGGADATVAITAPDAEVFRSWKPRGKVFSLPSAFDESTFHPFFEDVATERPVVLMVGNYTNPGNRDGAEQVIRKVVTKVAARHPEVIFRFVGIGFPAGLTHPNVENAGFVSDLTEEYRRAKIILVPIRQGGGIKIKAVEALAFGRLVISTPKGMEGIEHEKFELTRVGNIDKFPELINSALAQPARRTTRNWNLVREKFGNQTQMLTIQAQIERAIGRRTTRQHAFVPVAYRVGLLALTFDWVLRTLTENSQLLVLVDQLFV